MLPIGHGDGPGSPLPGDSSPIPPEGAPGGENHPRVGHAVTPAQPPKVPVQPTEGPAQTPDEPAVPLGGIVPPQAMAHGGTFLRPGAVAWGGSRDPAEAGYTSCEAIERGLAAVMKNPAELPSLLPELAASQLWLPLPVRHRPFTDGAAVRLPLIGYQDEDFVPAFTSVLRLATWADQADAAAAGRRAGDTRTVPHIVVPAAGLAQRLPAGLGIALNPGAAPGLPLYPECVPYLARFPAPGADPAAGTARGRLAMEHLVLGTRVRFLIGHPPAEPAALLSEARAVLRALPAVRQASRAWLSVPGHGEGLVISLALDDPGSEEDREAAADAIQRAAAAVPLRVPFPLDVTFPGESAAELPVPGTVPHSERPETPAPADAIDAWIAGNTRPFYTRG